nr:MAG TPA: hypothetical protein [Caudoviricetes sp.]
MDQPCGEFYFCLEINRIRWVCPFGIPLDFSWAYQPADGRCTNEEVQP